MPSSVDTWTQHLARWGPTAATKGEFLNNWQKGDVQMEVAQCVRAKPVRQKEARHTEMIKYFIKSDSVSGSVDDPSSETFKTPLSHFKQT